ncbi:hypothetical protein [Pseudomonas sp. 6D_7.1_Bac1]|jgi:hypothetical protein|uniref:hypothetical protein n=1 Tax=Pseudomonas sp. 6D_7.1_Bac1 TaxID=2971615 RepID=UPI0021CA3ADD|nr:hypothetical protein [Pseudomonas sp. 6D_7.1_Bac1]MCU1750197.1 hypothetical protein [Pseudomonas sp. 6D_7.1_Bac1]
MNRFVLGTTALALSGLLGTLAQAGADIGMLAAVVGEPVVLAQNLPDNTDNPYNSPIRRANPNSMQGTQPNAPAVRGSTTVPVPRPPTLENGGIGNGYPRSGTAPGSVKPYIPSNPPPRDPDTSNY